MVQPRRQVEDLRAPTNVQPVAQTRDNVYISRPPGVRLDRTNYEGIGRGLAGIWGQANALYREKEIKAGVAAVNELQVEAEKNGEDLQKAFARAVSRGDIPETASPYFLVGLRQTAARAFADRWATDAEVALQERGAIGGMIGEDGLPVAGVDPEDIISESFASAQESARKTNAALFDDPYFQRQMEAQHAEALPRLRRIAAAKAAEARQLAHRQLLQEEGLNILRKMDAVDDPAEYFKVIQSWADEALRKKSVARPQEAVWGIVQAFLEEVAVEDPSEALDRLQQLRELKIGPVSIGDGVHSGDVAKLEHSLIVRADAHERKREAREAREDQKAVDEYVEKSGDYAALVGAADKDQFDAIFQSRIVNAIRADGTLPGLDVQQTQSYVRDMVSAGDIVATTTKSQQEQRWFMFEEALHTKGPVEAEAMLDSLTLEQRNQARLKIEQFNIVEPFLSQGQVGGALKALAGAVESVDAGTDEATNARIDENTAAYRALYSDLVAELEEAPTAEARRKLTRSFIPRIDELRQKMRDENIRIEKEKGTTFKDLFAAFSKDAPGSIEKLEEAKTTLSDEQYTRLLGMHERNKAVVRDTAAGAEKMAVAKVEALLKDVSLIPQVGAEGGPRPEHPLAPYVAVVETSDGIESKINLGITEEGVKMMEQLREYVSNDFAEIIASDEAGNVRATEGAGSLTYQKYLEKAIQKRVDGYKSTLMQKGILVPIGPKLPLSLYTDPPTIVEPDRDEQLARAAEAPELWSAVKSRTSPAIFETHKVYDQEKQTRDKTLPAAYQLPENAFDDKRAMTRAHREVALNAGMLAPPSGIYDVKTDGPEPEYLLTEDFLLNSVTDLRRPGGDMRDEAWLPHPHAVALAAVAKIKAGDTDAPYWVRYAGEVADEAVHRAATKTKLGVDVPQRLEWTYVSAHRLTGIWYQQILDGEYKAKSTRIPIKNPDLIDWKFTPLFSTHEELEAMDTYTKSTLFVRLGLRFDEDVIARFDAFQHQAIERIVP